MKKLTLIAFLMLTNQAVAADKLSLILDWFINPDHGPIIIAVEKAFYIILS